MTANWSDPHRLPGSPACRDLRYTHRLGLSHSIVKHHRANARSKVGAATAAQLVRILAARKYQCPAPPVSGTTGSGRAYRLRRNR